MDELERDWRATEERQINPTVGSVARVMQMQTMGRWLDGWRRSRFTGLWLFFGPGADPNRIQDEVELAGRLRGEATARVARQLVEKESRAEAEARTGENAVRAAERAARRVSEARSGKKYLSNCHPGHNLRLYLSMYLSI